MKGKFTWLMALMLCLMVYTPAQGAIVWDDDASLLHPGQTTTLVTTNPVSSNGGTFGYFPGGKPAYVSAANNVSPGTTGTSTITENFVGHGQMILNANSQGEVIGDGFKAQIQTSIAFNDAGGPANYFAANGNAAHVIQGVTATLSRQFVNDGGPLTVDLSALLEGTVNFNTFGDPDNDSYYASYGITANIDLLEIGPEGAPVNVFHIEITEDPATWNQVIEGIKLRSMDDGFYYQLNCGLNAGVNVKNMLTAGTGFWASELNGPFLIGEDSPMILTTGLINVHPAPIGPSDSDGDDDVDGHDLATFAQEVKEGSNSISIAEFADNFGVVMQ